MKRLLPLILLGLAACDSPFEHHYPRTTMPIEHDGRSYAITSQFDVLDRTWFARIALSYGRLEEADRDAVLAAFQSGLGPKVCDGRQLTVAEGELITGFGAKTVRYLSQLGEWQVHGYCA